MSLYIKIVLGFGIATVLMAYIPQIFKKLKITYSLPLLFIGIALYYLNVPVKWSVITQDNPLVKIVTEFIVVISLMGAGLKIGFRYCRTHWKNPLRLIHTTMPIYMAGIFVMAYFIIGLDGPTSLLLAAVCAPTDPVMASEMQLQNHNDRNVKNTGMRYVLTAEAGLNDGIAFPFVYMAILWNKQGTVDFWEWAGYYFFYKILIGVAIGSLFGYIYSWSVQRLGQDQNLGVISGFVSIALAAASFALAEAASGYGFLSAFFTGLFAQYHNHTERDDHSKKEMVLFTEETEKFLTIIFILLFGGLVANGILKYVGTTGILTAVVIVLVLRPLAGLAGMRSSGFTFKKKLAISFFGIKGIGSFFYLAYGLAQTNFGNEDELYAIVSWVVLTSIVVHGISGLRTISYFERNNPG